MHMVLYALSISASLTIFVAAACALNRMVRKRLGAPWPVVWGYLSLFCGAGWSTLVSGWRIATGGDGHPAMQLSVLVMMAGLALLLVFDPRLAPREKHGADAARAEPQ